MSAPTVAVLFARADSVYKTIPGCDVYDLARDARTFPGGMPGVFLATVAARPAFPDDGELLIG